MSYAVKPGGPVIMPHRVLYILIYLLIYLQ